MAFKALSPSHCGSHRFDPGDGYAVARRPASGKNDFDPQEKNYRSQSCRSEPAVYLEDLASSLIEIVPLWERISHAECDRNRYRSRCRCCIRCPIDGTIANPRLVLTSERSVRNSSSRERACEKSWGTVRSRAVHPSLKECCGDK